MWRLPLHPRTAGDAPSGRVRIERTRAAARSAWFLLAAALLVDASAVAWLGFHPGLVAAGILVGGIMFGRASAHLVREASIRRARTIALLAVPFGAAALLLVVKPGAALSWFVPLAMAGAVSITAWLQRRASGAPGLPAVRGFALGMLVVGGITEPFLGAGAWTGLLFTAGGGMVLLDALGSRHPSAGERLGWDLVGLWVVILASAAASLRYAIGMNWIRGAGVSSVAGAAGVLLIVLCAIGFALGMHPPKAPRVLRQARSTSWEVVAHGAAGMAMLNTLFLSLTIFSYWSLKAIFGVLFLWQACVVAVEFRALRHSRKRAHVPLRKLAADPPVTVIVAAANEEGVLERSLEANLAVDYPLRFIVVPAIKSKDHTVEIARRALERAPNRVRLVLGDSGSKANDLNKAWAAADTDLVLILDADETIDADSLRHAVALLADHPDVGVVQGRKVSQAPDASPLARFISAERRYSTWLDHVLHGEELGSGHFGGSAALVRRDVVTSLGGFTDRTLTEDIEFTLRLHLEGRWRIVYSPEVIVREADPRTFADLLRQRTRWARGWAQCFGYFFGDVLRKRRQLGAKRAFGLVLLLLIAVSALWTTFVPATLIMRFAGFSPLLPIAITIPLTMVMLPGRFLSYGYAARFDPVIPLRVHARTYAELALYAYLWILLGWFIQLHALYAEFAKAPKVWHVTGKGPAATSAPDARSATAS